MKKELNLNMKSILPFSGLSSIQRQSKFCQFLKKLKDSDDAKFFDVAYSANAEYTISENTRDIIQMEGEKTKTYSFKGQNTQS